MKISSFVAFATSAAVTLLSGSVDAQNPVNGFTPVTGPTFGNIVRRMPVQELANTRPDVYNMFILALVRNLVLALVQQCADLLTVCWAVFDANLKSRDRFALLLPDFGYPWCSIHSMARELGQLARQQPRILHAQLPSLRYVA
jgi:hypothetical protein